MSNRIKQGSYFGVTRDLVAVMKLAESRAYRGNYALPTPSRDWYAG